MSATATLTCASCGKPITSTRLRGLCAACLVRGARSATGAQYEPDDEEPAGSPALFRIPGHDVLEEIARGGMGIVYRARQHDPAREVAVKMLLPGGATPALRERFRNEARTMAELNHPGVLPLYQFGEHGGTPWFTMKLAGGGSLAERLKKAGDPLRTDVRRAASLMAEIAEAVAYAHERGVLHRDLKPGNILFDGDGRVCVADFGLAKLDTQSAAALTHSRTMLGTPHYMAPELAAKAGTTATVATDVYALGAIFYELLAGHPPFQSESLAGLLRRIVEDDPPSLLTMRTTSSGIVPRGLAAIAGKAMAKEPARRYRDAAALAADLRAWLAGEAIAARPPGAWEKTMRWARRRPAWAAAVAAIVAGVSAVIVLQAKAGRDLREGRDIAEALRKEAVASKGAALTAQVAAARASGRIDLRSEALASAREAARMKVTPALRDDAITLLAAPGCEEIDRLQAGRCEHVPLSPDHDFMVAFTEGKLVLHDLSGKTPPFPLPPPPAAVRTVVFVTTHAALIFVRTRDGAHHLYDRAQNKWIRQWSQPGWGFALSPDEKYIAWGVDRAGEVMIEDLLTGRVRQFFSSARQQPVPRAFSPDGKSLAVGGLEEQGVEVWDLTSNTLKYTLKTSLVDQIFVHLAWRPDGLGLAFAMGAADLYSWILDSPEPWEERVTGHQAELMDVAWHPDGRWFATCGYDSTVRVWESLSRREVLRLPVLAGRIQFSRDGTELACHEFRGGELRRYRFTVPACTVQCPLPRDSPDSRTQRPAWGCSVSPDGVLGVSVSNYGIHYFHAVTGERMQWQPAGAPSDVNFTADGKRLFTAGAHGVMDIPVGRIAVPGHEMIVPLNVRTPLFPSRAFRCSWSDSRQRLAWTSEQGLAIKDFPDGPLKMLSAPPFGINPCTLSPDGRWVVSSGGDNAPDGLILWDADAPAQPPRVLPGFTNYSYARISPDSRIVYVYSENRICALKSGSWDVIWSVDRSGEAKSQHQVALSGDGYLLAAVEPPEGVCLYEAATGRRLALLRYPDNRWMGWISLDYAGARLIMTTLPDSVISWDLRALRKELAGLGLDWDAPAYPPAPAPVKLHLKFMQEPAAKGN